MDNSCIQIDWSILEELARKPETDRRRILRTHAEIDGVVEANEQNGEVALRNRLDQALDQLTLLELGIETGRFTFEECEVKEIAGLRELLQSEAFIRFLNAHLYFGIRFLAKRILDGETSGASTTNAMPVGLLHPPVIRPHGHEPAKQPYPPDLPDVPVALSFLDDYVTLPGEALKFELWLRGLWLSTGVGGDALFRSIARGMVAWIRNRMSFYCDLERIEADGQSLQLEWLARNPLSARFAVLDLYWLARLLRAEVTAVATVTYKHHSWFSTLALRCASDSTLASPGELQRAEQVLRSVFGFACDLIQNSVELTDAEYARIHAGTLAPDRPATTVDWRAAIDAELAEVESQRALRTFSSGPMSDSATTVAAENAGWSRRVLTGEHPGHLTGLAISGGGIRSATFNLGVMQGLQELDLLRQVDYLSTVSGGGYIGSWLVGNVWRTPYWLGRLTDWRQSIAHLRRYSNYLAPNTGFLSPDAWTMGTIWLRNTLLIQMTVVAWLALILTITRITEVIFKWSRPGELYFEIAIIVAVIAIGLGAIYNLGLAGPRPQGERDPGRSAWSQAAVVARIALPAWLGAFCAGAWMWSRGHRPRDFAELAPSSWAEWQYPLIALFLTFLVLAAFTLKDRNRASLAVGSVAAAAASCGTLFLELCGVQWLFDHWAHAPGHYGWYAFVFGPPLIMLSVAMAVVIFNGLCGRNTPGWINEWWSRAGSLLGISGLGFLAIGAVGIMGPQAVFALFRSHPNLSWSALAGGLGTIVSGLYAGNSSASDGTGHSTKQAAIDIVAKAAGFLFVGGSVVAVAFVLHEVLTGMGGDTRQAGVNYWHDLNSLKLHFLFLVAGVLMLLGVIFSWRFDLNTFGLNEFYRNRLVRCYLGATRWRPGWRTPHVFTGFDDADDIPLSTLRTRGRPLESAFRGPFPVVNCTLNLGGSSDLSLHTRRSTAFTVTPLYCGADRAKVGYAPTEGFDGGSLTLGRAMSVSGAAASPNSGYNTSPLASLLLTMFNVRLGWWFPNPGRSAWKGDGIGKFLLFRELFGLADEDGNYVNVSDGGHFENLGIYELVRRRCRVIIASDSECDPNLQFGSLGNVVRICETDFGAKIDLDVASVRKDAATGLSNAHCAVGTITYSNGSRGCIIYLKAAITGDEDVGVAQYRALHPDFPHESTADQFYAEDQFESYRRLGQHIVQHAFRGVGPGESPAEIGDRLADVWAPSGPHPGSEEAFAKDLDDIRERFRSSPDLERLYQQLAEPGAVTELFEPTQAEACTCLELIQFMESVFLGIRLDDYWEHPDNRGWALLFTGWARSPLFRVVWCRNIHKFGISFEYFCFERLGLPSVRPVARV